LYEDDKAVDATLSPDAIATLRNLAQKHEVSLELDRNAPYALHDTEMDCPALSGEHSTANCHGIRRVEIPMTMDAEFFGLIQQHVTPINELREKQQTVLEDEIHDLSKQLTILTTPKKWGKTDMYQWRQLFEMYLDAQIFFSTHERDHGSRGSAAAKEKLVQFQKHIREKGLDKAFKVKASHEALQTFYLINERLFKILRYQELNQQAIMKILKSKSSNSPLALN
jgi:E3 ubiquitin-protein ligase BAH